MTGERFHSGELASIRQARKRVESTRTGVKISAKVHPLVRELLLVALASGLSPSLVLRRWASGTTVPTVPELAKAAQAFGRELKWWPTGEAGEVDPPGHPSPGEATHANASSDPA